MDYNPITTFVKRVAARLLLDGSPFRFCGANVPNLHIIEDGPPNSPWLLPTAWEIEDAIKTARFVGGQNAVVRLCGSNLDSPWTWIR
jgi:hypothetical protein